MPRRHEELFSYNRESYKFDQDQRLEREMLRLEMQALQKPLPQLCWKNGVVPPNGNFSEGECMKMYEFWELGVSNLLPFMAESNFQLILAWFQDVEGKPTW